MERNHLNLLEINPFNKIEGTEKLEDKRVIVNYIIFYFI